jgi:ArsR family transcriptional regulator
MSRDAQDAATAPRPSPGALSISPAQRLAILKAISDPRRMEMLERIGAQPDSLGCVSLRECLPISAATLSHHMKELEAAGLVHVQREGKFARLTLRRDVWQAFLADLQKL